VNLAGVGEAIVSAIYQLIVGIGLPPVKAGEEINDVAVADKHGLGVVAASVQPAAAGVGPDSGSALGGLAGRRPRLVPLAGEPGTVAVVTTPDALDGDRALNPGGRYPDWVQAAAVRSVLPLGFYRPGRDAARVRCPLLVVVCDQDQTALAGPGSAAARRAPRAELVRLAGSHYAPFLAGHEQAVEAELSFLRRHLVDDARADCAAAAASASAQGGRA